MKRVGIVAKMRRLRKVTTTVDVNQKVAPNLLEQNVTAASPNEKWVSDISYVRTLEGWLYVAVILDLFSRKVVGLSMGDSLHTSLIIGALEQALQRRQPPPDLQHHFCHIQSKTSQPFAMKIWLFDQEVNSVQPRRLIQASRLISTTPLNPCFIPKNS